MSSSTRGRSGSVIGPEPDLEHLNIPSARRMQLITDLGEALGNDLVPSAFWAFLQVCNLERLQTMINVARVDPIFITFFADRCHEIPCWWMQRIPQKTPSTSNSMDDSGSRSQKRSSDGNDLPNPKRSRISRAEGPKDKARARDHKACALTGEIPIDVAHIYPNGLISSHNPDRISNFWKVLPAFWSPEQIRAWEAKIFRDPQHPLKPFDHCFNLICLNKDIHSMWNDGFLAFRPLGYHDEMRKLDIQVFWQPNQGHRLNDRIPITKKAISSGGLARTSRFDGVLTRRIAVGDEAEYVRSGHIFTLSTHDPIDHPLPSKELLEMQWHINRVVSLSGAAGTAEFEVDSDDDVPGSTAGSKGFQVQQWVDSFSDAYSSPNMPSHAPAPCPATSSTEGNTESEGMDVSYPTSVNPSPTKTREAVTAQTEPFSIAPAE